ncbi:uncharacterized protein LOC120272467 [Dioscorea cayenensis subsp. rotundata]|uniref:Uncharacterized protein LOC120272467 n=1 Tax=Dioscorea cayennensis subsp. rotundata TaxID=55577 RepID=A0AB40C5Z5_DIOCR|nr:uncharacterized protein LOC120272467 [Dioscorea cayenensis subsp. rotundata]XP_039135233.1 uncharacterized protein LOC120272467 [Dioscorea cayenensis subsp. rotundata]
MLNKRVASKRPRCDMAPIGEPNFDCPQQKARYACLKTKPFGVMHTIEWNDLEAIGLDEEALGLTSYDGWDKVLSISEPAYRELTLEVLSTIELIRPSRVSFQAFGVRCTLTNTQLGCFLGLYSEEVAQTPTFCGLPTDFPSKVTYTKFWNNILGRRTHESRKASRFLNPAHRYIHAFLLRH